MRRIVEDYEAKLAPPTGRSGCKAKAEWERFSDGSEKLSVRFRKLDLPKGSTVEIRLDGNRLGEIPVDRGAGRLEFDSRKGEMVARASAGQRIEVVQAGEIVLTGELIPD